MLKDTTSWTEISTYRQCPHKHKLQYKDGWRPAELAEPLATGILWHRIMDHHYTGVKLGAVPEATQAIIKLLDEYGARDKESSTFEMADALAWMYHGYREWAAEVDQGIEIIDVEGEFEAKMPSGIKLFGRYDLIIRTMHRYYWIVDHKSGKELPTDKELDLDDQTPLYIWGAQQSLDIPIRGACLNHAKTKRLKRAMSMKERFGRYWVYRTPSELAAVVMEADQTATKAKDLGLPAERHPDTQTCKWRCPFTEACIAGRREPHLETQILRAKGFYKRLDGATRD